jgi:FeS assembly protein IscX
MISPVELRRILAEWRLRMGRVRDILQPPTWSEKEWRQFSQALALMVRDHGRSWIIDPNVYWDLRWHLQDGAELVCQIEHIPGEKTSLVVAQNGGFATHVGSYTWLWAEFNLEGNFARDPYWVEGTWKDALTSLLLPLDRQASYLLAGRAETPDSLLLQDGARPNDQNYRALLPGISESGREPYAEPDEKIVDVAGEPSAPEPEKHHEVASEIENPATSSAASEVAVDLRATVDENPRSEIAGCQQHAATDGELSPSSFNSPPSQAQETSHAEAVAEPATDAPAPPLPETANGNAPAHASPRIDTPETFAIRWGMPQKLTWKDADEIAYALIDAHPDQDPLKLSFPKLHKLVIELEDFGDDPEKSSESILESIQMAWYEEVK